MTVLFARCKRSDDEDHRRKRKRVLKSVSTLLITRETKNYWTSSIIELGIFIGLSDQALDLSVYVIYRFDSDVIDVGV